MPGHRRLRHGRRGGHTGVRVDRPLGHPRRRPRYRDGAHGEPELLASCYRRCLEVADELGAASLAFPAISTGIYGYPPGDAARIAVRTLRETPTSVELARLIAFDGNTLRLYETELQG